MKRWILGVLVLFAACAHVPHTNPVEIAATGTMSTVRIERASGGICAGVAVDKHLVMTAAHCLDAVTGVLIVETHDGQTCVTESVMAADDGRDLALVWVLDCDLIPMPVAETVRVGEHLTVIGHPMGERWVVSQGSVSALDENWIWTDAHVWFGNSGGPAINDRGELVGIVSMLASSGHGILENVSGS